MGAFPVLDHEERLQLGDKTRLGAEKSFVAPLGSTAINVASVTPGLGSTAENIYDSQTADNWYLDWIFNTWNFDIITGYNDKIDFDQGGVKAATLTQGTYTLAQLCTQIATQLNAVVGISGTFAVSANENDKITISNDTANFELLPVTGVNKATSLLPHIGFKKDESDASLLGKRVEYSQKKIVLSVNNGDGAQTITKYVKLFSVAGDCLFSSDQDLTTWEPDIIKWVQKGRTSFLNAHREAQDQILYYLDKNGYTNIYQEKYDKFDIVDHSEVNEWSAFLALSIIMWGISNKSDDVFLKKHFEYKSKSSEARDRAVLRLDLNEDGVADTNEHVDISSGTLVTR